MKESEIKECMSRKVEKVMREYAAGTLKSSSGANVTDKKQALAIAYSEARSYCKEHKDKG